MSNLILITSSHRKERVGLWRHHQLCLFHPLQRGPQRRLPLVRQQRNHTTLRIWVRVLQMISTLLTSRRFGLSYTTFSYSSLSISGSVGSGSAPDGAGTSVSPWLHEKVITVTFTLSNTGSRAGTEIPQLYVSPPASAQSSPYILKGFDSIYLAAGASTTVTMKLSRFDLSMWDTSRQKFVVPSGTHGVTIGPSSRIRSLTGSVTI